MYISYVPTLKANTFQNVDDHLLATVYSAKPVLPRLDIVNRSKGMMHIYS